MNSIAKHEYERDGESYPFFWGLMIGFGLFEPGLKRLEDGPGSGFEPRFNSIKLLIGRCFFSAFQILND